MTKIIFVLIAMAVVFKVLAVFINRKADKIDKRN